MFELLKNIAWSIKNKQFGIDKWGVNFKWKGDDVIWVWWHKRINGKRYMSLSFCATYDSLKEIDEDWDNYYEACDRK